MIIDDQFAVMDTLTFTLTIVDVHWPWRWKRRLRPSRLNHANLVLAMRAVDNQLVFRRRDWRHVFLAFDDNLSVQRVSILFDVELRSPIVLLAVVDDHLFDVLLPLSFIGFSPIVAIAIDENVSVDNICCVLLDNLHVARRLLMLLVAR